jgi:hypothetical protein
MADYQLTPQETYAWAMQKALSELRHEREHCDLSSPGWPWHHFRRYGERMGYRDGLRKAESIIEAILQPASGELEKLAYEYGRQEEWLAGVKASRSNSE